MYKIFFSTFQPRIVLVIILATLCFSSLLSPATPQALAQSAPSVALFGTDIRTVSGSGYHPLVRSADPTVDPVSILIDKASAASTNWARYEVTWARIQPSKTSWDTNLVIQYKKDLQRIMSKGITPIVLLEGTPSWATSSAVNSWAFPPTNTTDLTDFISRLMTEFTGTAVGGFSINPTYWQIWNEPDLNGVPSTDYYNKLLKPAATTIRAKNGSAKIILAGLALNTSAANCTSGSFLDCIMGFDNSVYDIIDYHSYADWNVDPTSDWDLFNNGEWKPWGGGIVGKARYIRSLLAAHSLNKPLIMGEVGLRCTNCATSSTFLGDNTIAGDQANFVIRAYTRAAAEGLLASHWYAMGYGEFDNTDLLTTTTPQNNTLPPPPIERNAYKALKFFAGKLKGATYAGSLSSGIVEGYRFCKASTEYRVYWTKASSRIVPLTIPTNAVRYNAIGNSHNSSATFDPLITETVLPATCVPQRSASWTNDLTTASYGAPADFTGVTWYTQKNGPCEGRPAGTCHFDTRSIRVESNGDIVVSITAYGKYWTYNQTTQTIIAEKQEMTAVSRWMGTNGPCTNRTVGTCLFDTRSIVMENGRNKEYITAYGKWWKFDLLDSSGDPNNGKNLTAIARFASGPCVGLTLDNCSLDTYTLFWNGTLLGESITAYGKYWNINQDGSGTASGPLESLVRFTATNGPCQGWPAGFCTIRTRTLRYDSSNHLIESITN